MREVQAPASKVARQDGPIVWGKIIREQGVKCRSGQGDTGLIYLVSRQREWGVVVRTPRGRELEIGTARLQDHAMALACLWEQAVASGRVDMS